MKLENFNYKYTALFDEDKDERKLSTNAKFRECA